MPTKWFEIHPTSNLYKNLLKEARFATSKQQAQGTSMKNINKDWEVL